MDTINQVWCDSCDQETVIEIDRRAFCANHAALRARLANIRPVKERCGSGWTGDRCSKRLGHQGDHSNVRPPRRTRSY